jgi:hypothetical protein
MKIKPFVLALCCVSVGALLLPDDVLARGGRGGFHGANRANVNRANIDRFGVTRDWSGNVVNRGWGWGAAGAAVGAAAAGTTLYNNASCYQQQQVWNGSAYVWQTLRVC